MTGLAYPAILQKWFLLKKFEIAIELRSRDLP